MAAVDSVSGCDNRNIFQSAVKRLLVLFLFHCTLRARLLISIAGLKKQINRHKTRVKQSGDKAEVPCKRRPALLSLARTRMAFLAWPGTCACTSSGSSRSLTRALGTGRERRGETLPWEDPSLRSWIA